MFSNVQICSRGFGFGASACILVHPNATFDCENKNRRNKPTDLYKRREWNPSIHGVRTSAWNF